MHEFEKEYMRCRGAMYRAARRIVNKEAALVAVDEAATRLWAIADRIDYMSPDRVIGLFCTTARNAAINMKKKQGFSKRDDKTWTEIHIPHTRNHLDVERTIAVHRALAKLHPLEAHIAWHYYALEFSPTEIVESLAKDGVNWTVSNFHKFVTSRVKPNLRAALLSVGADGLL